MKRTQWKGFRRYGAAAVGLACAISSIFFFTRDTDSHQPADEIIADSRKVRKSAERSNYSHLRAPREKSEGAFRRAIAKIESAPDPQRRKSALIDLARLHSLDDPGGVFDLITSNAAGLDQEECLRYFFTSLALDGSLEGITFLDRLPIGSSRTNLIRLFWANAKDMSKADITAFYQSLDLPEDQNGFLSSLEANRGLKDAVSDFLEANQSDPKLKAIYIEQSVIDVAKADGLSAGIIEAIKFFENDPVAFSSVIQEATATAVQQSAPLAIESLLKAREQTEPQRLDQSLAYAFSGYAQSNPTSAADKALSVKDPGAQSIAIKASVQTWINLDSVAASAWISQLPNGQARTDAVEVMVRFLEQKGDLDLAQSWREQVGKQKKGLSLRKMR
jgi:hypothetical protein